jgi:L-asparaginase II
LRLSEVLECASAWESVDKSLVNRQIAGHSGSDMYGVLSHGKVAAFLAVNMSNGIPQQSLVSIRCQDQQLHASTTLLLYAANHSSDRYTAPPMPFVVKKAFCS